MNIKYDLTGQVYNFKLDNSIEKEKLNFLLTNNKGDFLNMGVISNTCKFQGLNYCNPKTLEIFKVIDEIIIKDLEVESIEYTGYSINRKFNSKFSKNIVDSSRTVNEKETLLKTTNNLIYDENEPEANVLEDNISEDNDISKLEKAKLDSIEDNPKDKFYLGPTGGLVYEVSNLHGEIFIDLDIRKQNDFSKWSRNYNSYRKNGVVFVKYLKESQIDESGINTEAYEFYFAIKASNFSYNLIEDWIEKEYSYSKARNSEHSLYVYRFMKVNINGSKRMIMASGLSEEEVLMQIELLEKHQFELENFDKSRYIELTKDINFNKPISQDVLVAYKLSNNAIYNFLSKNLNRNTLKQGSVAGYPWFADVWTRDELISLRSFINNGEYALVKERIYYYLNLIDFDSGMLPRIDKAGSLQSADSVFWLLKRIVDLIFKLEETGSYNSIFSQDELSTIFDKFNLVFTKLINNSWDKELELFTPKDGDSWMDTIHVDYPLDIQVQFLDFISSLAIIASLLSKKEEATRFIDLENTFATKIKETYFRNGKLYAEAFNDRIDSNVFLVYYIYPNLFTSLEWEKIFDNTLRELRTSWGGISTLSKKDSRFKSNYTGENNSSYHNGDSWFWINNLAALSMDHLNEQKYRSDIRKILITSTKDILKYGTIGFASEISSASSQKAEGSMAQLWSSSTYLEMIDAIFSRRSE